MSRITTGRLARPLDFARKKADGMKQVDPLDHLEPVAWKLLDSANQTFAATTTKYGVLTGVFAGFVVQSCSAVAKIQDSLLLATHLGMGAVSIWLTCRSIFDGFRGRLISLGPNPWKCWEKSETLGPKYRPRDDIMRQLSEDLIEYLKVQSQRSDHFDKALKSLALLILTMMSAVFITSREDMMSEKQLKSEERGEHQTDQGPPEQKVQPRREALDADRYKFGRMAEEPMRVSIKKGN